MTYIEDYTNKYRLSLGQTSNKLFLKECGGRALLRQASTPYLGLRVTGLSSLLVKTCEPRRISLSHRKSDHLILAVA